MARQRKRHRASPAPVKTPEPGPRPSEGSRSQIRWWPELLVFGSATVVYLNALGNGFVYDARVLIQDNLAVQRSTEWLAWFTRFYWWGAVEHSNLYRPLTILSFVVNYRLAGLNPFPFHLTNVLLHGAVSVLVLALGRRLLEMPTALVGALIFAVHPLHTEVVAWIAGRAELLSSLFALVASLAFLRITEPEEQKPWWWVAVAIGGYFLSLLSKEHAAPLPLWWAFAWWLRRPRTPLGRVGATFAGATVAMGLYLLLREIAIAQDPSQTSQPHVADVISSPLLGTPLWQRWLTAAAVVTRYGWLWVWPARLTVDYSYAQIVPSSGLGPWEITGFLLLGGWGVAMVVAARLAPGLALALAHVPVTFAVASNFLFLVGALMSERFTYLATVGLSIASGWLLTRGTQFLAARFGRKGEASSPEATDRPEALGAGRRGNGPKWFLAGLVAVLVVAMGTRTVVRNFDWKSDYTIYRAALAVSPRSANVLAGLGREEMYRGNFGAARELLEETVRIAPKYAKARIWLGLVFANLGQDERAIEQYRQASDTFPQSPVGNHNLGVLFWKRGRLDEAVAEYREALRRQPHYVPSRIDLGWLLYARRKPADAMEQFRTILRFAPNHPEALYGAAVVSAALGDLAAARSLGRQAEAAGYRVPEKFWRALDQSR